jgi:hypothetical protein
VTSHTSIYTSLQRLDVVAELTNRRRGRVFSYRRYVDELGAGLDERE